MTKPRVPASGVYLGLDPQYSAGHTVATQALWFGNKIGRTLAIVSYYIHWGRQPTWSQLAIIASRGSIPMINMDCGVADAEIVAGYSDKTLRALAIAYRQYAKPVLFRWFWEMNLTKVGKHPRCLGTTGASGYVAAYRHIWDIFHEEGADNVAFVWGISDAQSAKNRFDTAYYPGDSYVNWIAADLYDRPNRTLPWGDQFGPFYHWWSSYAPNKPIMLAETGAVGASAQALWLSQIAAALSTTVPGVKWTPFTHVHAVVYVDAEDLYSYIIANEGAGLVEFKAIAHKPYFSQMG